MNELKEETDDILNKIKIHKKQIDNIVNNIEIHKKQNELYELIKLHNNQYSLGRGFLGIQIRTYIWLVSGGKLHISPADIENKSYEITDINTLDKKINELKNKKPSAFYKFLAYII